MFREMRRSAQELSADECRSILQRCTCGVLSVSGDDGYPYGVPVSYLYQDNKIYLHCATTGQKLDANSKHDKVSFCVISQDLIVPQQYTTYFLSVILFGRARILTQQEECRRVTEALALKYAPQFKEGLSAELDQKIARLSCVEITIEHMTGKGAAKLLQARKEAP